MDVANDKKILAEIMLIQGENGKEKSKYNRNYLQYKCTANKSLQISTFRKLYFAGEIKVGLLPSKKICVICFPESP